MSKKLNKEMGRILYEEVADLDSLSTSDSESKIWNVPREYLSAFKQNAVLMCYFSYTPELPEGSEIPPELAAAYQIGFLTGYHIYLRERSYRRNGEHFTYTTDARLIADTVAWCFRMVETDSKKRTWTKPALEAFQIAHEQMLRNVNSEQFQMKNHELSDELFNIFFSQTLVMGYNFAHELIIPQIPLDADWLKDLPLKKG